MGSQPEGRRPSAWPPWRLPAVLPAPQCMTLFAPFAMNAIMNDGRRKHQPQPEDQDETAREPVPAGDVHSQSHVSDERPRSERNDETDLGPH
jgi:hypothetical protein